MDQCQASDSHGGSRSSRVVATDLKASRYRNVSFEDQLEQPQHLTVRWPVSLIAVQITHSSFNISLVVARRSSLSCPVRSSATLPPRTSPPAEDIHPGMHRAAGRRALSASGDEKRRQRTTTSAADDWLRLWQDRRPASVPVITHSSRPKPNWRLARRAARQHTSAVIHCVYASYPADWSARQRAKSLLEPVD